VRDDTCSDVNTPCTVFVAHEEADPAALLGAR